MKGIILSAGYGTRLYPLTLTTSKQLLPVYDKPIIYYPLCTLISAGIKDILIITTPHDLGNFNQLLGDGSKYGIHISYAIQDKPRGLAEAFIIGRHFIGNDSVCMILGDNIFYGSGITKKFEYAKKMTEENKACVFGYFVNDPYRFGVAEFSDNGDIISIEEKPSCPKSNYAVTGLYFYPNDVVQKALLVRPSDRGELEITDLNNLYIKDNRLSMCRLGQGYVWMDVGTHESLLDASNFVKQVEEHEHRKISCIEEVCYRQGLIDKQKLIELQDAYKNTQYGKYLMDVIDNQYLEDTV